MASFFGTRRGIQNSAFSFTPLNYNFFQIFLELHKFFQSSRILQKFVLSSRIFHEFFLNFFFKIKFFTGRAQILTFKNLCKSLNKRLFVPFTSISSIFVTPSIFDTQRNEPYSPPNYAFV